MKTLYLIASHTNPGQVERLARLLARGGGERDVLIHHDAKSRDIPDIAGIGNTFLYPSPVAVHWGDFSQVRLFLDVCLWALEHHAFDWLVFLSGQDYPIRKIEEIEADLSRMQEDACLTAYPIARHPIWRAREGFDRYMFRYYSLPDFPYSYRFPGLVAWLQNLANRANALNPVFRYRWMPQGLPGRIGIRVPTPFSRETACYAGPQWGNFSRASLEYVRDFVRGHPAFLAHYARTLNPDESCVLSILHSAADAGRLRIRHDNRRYVHWENEKIDPSPKVILASDYDRVMASGMDFARKFDTRVDSAVLDRIDREVHGLAPE